MSNRIPKWLSVFMLSGCVLVGQWAYAQAPAEQTAPPAAKAAAPEAAPAAKAAQPAPEATPAAKAAQPASEAAPAAEPQAALPAPMDKELAFLLGKWDTKIKIFPNPLSGNTNELKGAGKAEYQIFGKVIEGTLTNETSNGKFGEKEFLWYDQNAKAYNIIAISQEGYAVNKKLKKVGDKYVVTYSGIQKPQGGKETDFTVQAKYKIISDTEVKYSSEVKLGKADFVPFMQLKMQRVSK